MKRFVLYFLVLAMIFGSCRKKDNNYRATGDYLVLGRLSGYCYEPCSYFYLIRQNEVRKSGAVRDYDPNLAYNIVAPAGAFDLVRNTEQHLPAPLFSQNNTSFGQPNSHDQGAYYVVLSRGGQVYKWIIDPDIRDSASHFLQPLTVELDSVLEKLYP